jgi:hypothetical protein
LTRYATYTEMRASPLWGVGGLTLTGVRDFGMGGARL